MKRVESDYRYLSGAKKEEKRRGKDDDSMIGKKDGKGSIVGLNMDIK